MMRLRIRCPCNKCLVQATCEQSCDNFGQMAIWFYYLEVFTCGIFEVIDDCINEDSKTQKVFDFFGEYIFLPTFVLTLVLITGIKFHHDERTKFDERYEHWTKKTGRETP